MRVSAPKRYTAITQIIEITLIQLNCGVPQLCAESAPMNTPHTVLTGQ